jgi:hypothetical protein
MSSGGSLGRTPGWLAGWLAGWLLVFDNADHPDAVSAFLPPAAHGASHGDTHHGRVLVTTRCQSAAGTTLVPLDAMNTDEGVQLLLTQARIDAATQSSHDAQVCRRDLVSQMGGLPLALDQAGAYIRQKRCGGAALCGAVSLSRGRAADGEARVD